MVKISLMTFKLKIKFYLDVIELSLTASVQKDNLAGCWVQRTGTAELFCLAPSQRSQESMLAPVTRLDWQLLSSPAWLHSWSPPGCWLAYVESGLEPPQKPKRRLKRSLRVVGLQENGKRVKIYTVIKNVSNMKVFFLTPPATLLDKTVQLLINANV